MSKEQDDFDPQEALKNIQANFEQPNKFAQIFCDAASTQKCIDEALKGIIKSLIQHDKETRNYIKNIIKELEREDLITAFKKFGFLGWTLIVAMVSAIVGALVKGLF